jgi:hypothetical protein
VAPKTMSTNLFRGSFAAVSLIAGVVAVACGSSDDAGLNSSNPDGGSSGGSSGKGGSSGSAGKDGGSCASDKDCTPLGLLCSTEVGRCVECLNSTDCGVGEHCVSTVCVPRCDNSLDCTDGKVCDTSSGVCVECVRDADCEAGQRCSGNACQDSCDSDNDCTPLGKLCDFASGLCYDPGTGGTGGTGGAGGKGGTGGGGSGGSGGSSGNCGMLDMVVLFDHSGSMADIGSGGTEKFATARDSFEAWAEIATGVRVAVQLHPVSPSTPPPTTCTIDADCGLYGPCTPPFGCTGGISADTSCVGGDYSKPVVPLSALPGAAAAIGTAFQNLTTVGGSPHTPALEGGLLQARRISNDNPSDTTVIVFIADGDPTSCTGSASDVWAPVAAVAASGLAGSPSIRTYMVAISDGTIGFTDVAQAGGTTEPIQIPAADVGNAMATIQSKHPCP